MSEDFKSLALAYLGVIVYFVAFITDTFSYLFKVMGIIVMAFLVYGIIKNWNYKGTKKWFSND